ncbi:GNAT family N-acetyltransferase [Shewanella maritima]|uniref:GNAT family N-acetyltransferase n=1 Tax=Shewanella maritima TaxID=2520507 RepID=A0A411PEV4_9GAMM|nr:GNAT family N-acetyltransferase [Shewanella maritima]QBF82081.1 GNAT family N-acetyltransferase [Shewanella maritima]
MQLIEVSPNDIATELLLEADPCVNSIARYLNEQSFCFAAYVPTTETAVGACIVDKKAAHSVEIMNISIAPQHQKLGIGTALLNFVLEQLKAKGVTRVELGTGTFGHQLSYYQRCGFRVDAVIKDHFIDNYDQPIFENGIQHQDMLRLYIEL